MKLFLILTVIVSIAYIFYVDPEIVGNAKKNIKDTEYCAGLDSPRKEGLMTDYSIGVKKILSGCF